MWLIRKQVTWPITCCFNDYNSGAGKQFGQTLCSLSSRRSKESYCRPHPGLLSRKRVIALLRLLFFVRGEETVPAVSGDEDIQIYGLRGTITNTIYSPLSFPVSRSLLPFLSLIEYRSQVPATKIAVCLSIHFTIRQYCLITAAYNRLFKYTNCLHGSKIRL